MLNKIFRIGILLCCVLVTAAFLFQTIDSHYQLNDIKREFLRLRSESSQGSGTTTKNNATPYIFEAELDSFDLRSIEKSLSDIVSTLRDISWKMQ
jgi:hypothetical protein